VSGARQNDAIDPLQTTGFRLGATLRPRPRRSPFSKNQAVKETPEQIVAQLDGDAARANECADEEDGAPLIAAICFQAAGRGPPPIRSAPPAAMPRHRHRGT